LLVPAQKPREPYIKYIDFRPKREHSPIGLDKKAGVDFTQKGPIQLYLIQSVLAGRMNEQMSLPPLEIRRLIL